MRRQFPALIGLLWFLLAGLAAAETPAPIDIKAPVEGAAVKSPVGFEIGPFPGATEGYHITLEVAHGLKAADGFRKVTHTPGKADASGRITGPLFFWDAQGVTGGPYTVRVTALSRDSSKVLAQSVRSIVLDAPDQTPIVTLSVPESGTGSIQVGGAVQDSDVQSWELQATGPGGKSLALGSGNAAGILNIAWESAVLPDGTYTLRLSARDKAGNAAEVSKIVTVTNPPPMLAVNELTIEPGPAEVTVRYTSATPVRVTLTLRPQSGGDAITGARAEGAAGTDTSLGVQLQLTGLAPGRYTAVVEARDEAGRAAKAEGAVRVLARVPPPSVSELPAASADAVTLRWSAPDTVERTGFAILRNGPDGTQVIAELGPGATAYTDRPGAEGPYSYRVALITSDGRWIEGPGRSTVIDRTPPVPAGVTVSPVDGVGLQMRWTAAEDPGGIAGYRVELIEPQGRRALAQLNREDRSLALPLPPGEYRAVLVAVDQAGNTGESGLLAFRVEPGAVALLSGGKFAPADVPGFIEDGRTWVPLRFFAEALGYHVVYDPARQTATVMDLKTGRMVIAGVGMPELLLSGAGAGGVRVALPVPPRLVGGRMLVPLRALAEALGARVAWDAQTRTVEISAGR